MVDVVFNNITCDLNVEISGDKLSLATKLGNSSPTEEPNGFWYIMGSAKATHGVKNLKGKVYFETVVTEHLEPTSIKGSLEDIAPSVRIGWSTINTRTNVGEHVHSFGYCSDGSKVSDAKFTDYGESFDTNEVIVSYIDFDTKPYEIGFIRHGIQQGTAFQLPKNCPQLFPHVSIRNAKVISNFGLRAPTFQPPNDYIFIGDLMSSDLNSGPLAPKTLSGCDIVMMVGLHGSGKTRWATSQVNTYPSKHYHLLSTDSLLNSMTNKGKSPVTQANRAKMYKMIDSLLQTLVNNFQRFQNVIFDDCFVEGDIRSKRLSALTSKGFKPRVVFVMPTEKMYETYLEARLKSCSNKSITIDDVLRQKVNLSLPEQDSTIHDIVFTDQQRKAASILAIQYNQEAMRMNQKSRFSQNQIVNNDPRGLNELEKFLWSKDLLYMPSKQRELLKDKNYVYSAPFDSAASKPVPIASGAKNTTVNNGSKRENNVSHVTSKPTPTSAIISNNKAPPLKSTSTNRPLSIVASAPKQSSVAQRRLQLARSRLASHRVSGVSKPLLHRSHVSVPLLPTVYDASKSRHSDNSSRRLPNSSRGASSSVNYREDNDRRGFMRQPHNPLISYTKDSGKLLYSKRNERVADVYRSAEQSRGAVYNPYMPDYRNVPSLSHRLSGPRDTTLARTHRLPPPRTRHSRYDADPSRLP